MRTLRAAVTAALFCWAFPAVAQDPRGKPINAPAGYLPGTAIYCDDGTNHAVPCSFAGGAGGDPSSTGVAGSATAPGNVSMVGSFDGSNVRRLTIDSAGRIVASIYSLPAITGTVGIAGPVAVTGSFWQATQPISAASLPLPVGAATAANQASILAALGSPYQVGGALPLPAGASTAAKQDSLLAAVGSPYQAGGALPLPGGAATATAQATTTAAITATQAATGALAATAQTVTTTLPQLASSAGLAISFGTTAATLFNANASRHFVVVQVQGASGGCYVNGTAAASADANSLYIPAGGYFESSTHVGTGIVSIVCTAASTPVYSRQG